MARYPRTLPIAHRNQPLTRARVHRVAGAEVMFAFDAYGKAREGRASAQLASRIRQSLCYVSSVAVLMTDDSEVVAIEG